MSGFVTDTKGEALPGATVVAVHEPSGSRYGSVTLADGRYNIPNARVGGPYTLTVSSVGYKEQVHKDIYLSLGVAFNADFKLSEDSEELSEVVVTAETDGLISSDRTGASTNLDNRAINSLPTISRSLNDFTRLTPQSNGTSFAGRDNRFNNYTIDGNIYNNNFGLSSDQFAGSNPVSLDAIEAVQINLAPYDVRTGGFTGASVNAITKSGTNEFSGSAYTFIRNQSFQGNKIGENELTFDDFNQNIIGARLGGPIIKNKLFFFVNVESETSTRPGQQNLAAAPGREGDNVTRVPAERLDFIRTSLRNIYGYDPGAYEGYDFATKNLRLNARIDYNISDKHKLAVRFNRFTSIDDTFINASSTSNSLPGGFGNRNSLNSMHFANSNYTTDQTTNSFVAELNSMFSSKIANNLNIGYTSFFQERGIPGDQAFPFIEVVEEGQYYTAMGNELFSVANNVRNNTFNVTNNLTYFGNKHTITAGFNLELMTFENSFNRFFHGVYRYGSYNDFVEAVINRNPDVQPTGFVQGFAFGSNPGSPAVDETAFGQFGLYVQDEFQVNRNFKLTYGLRMDGQFFPKELAENPAIRDNFKFANPAGGDSLVADVSALPKFTPLWSPRVGFNWDVLGDKSLQIRGGSGIFTGRIPFVWISNQVNNNGILRGFYVLQRNENRNDFDANPRPFNPDVRAYLPENPQPSSPSGDLAVTADDFRFPQVWRTNIGIDKTLPGGLVATLEGIYTRNINDVLPQNINLPASTGTFAGVDNRPFYGSNRINAPFNQAIYLTNTNKGYYAAVTLQVQKPFDNGLFASLAYTRSVSRDQGLTGGSTAGSLWTNPVLSDRNNPEVSFTRFDTPHRVVGLVSYSKEYAGFAKTTISLFYQGSAVGAFNENRFSYVIGGNMMGDNGTPLLFVPNSAEDIIFVDIVQNGETRFTAQQQRDAFEAYINQDDYLSGRKGDYAERNGAVFPWVHRFDLRFLQDFYVKVGKNEKRNTIQLSLDIMNFGNLLNSEWGVQSIVNQQTLLQYRGRDAENRPTFIMNLDRGELPTETFRKNINVSQVWQMQFGIRYIFN